MYYTKPNVLYKTHCETKCIQSGRQGWDKRVCIIHGLACHVIRRHCRSVEKVGNPIYPNKWGPPVKQSQLRYWGAGLGSREFTLRSSKSIHMLISLWRFTDLQFWVDGTLLTVAKLHKPDRQGCNGNPTCRECPEKVAQWYSIGVSSRVCTFGQNNMYEFWKMYTPGNAFCFQNKYNTNTKCIN